jgi:hypothetical protein
MSGPNTFAGRGQAAQVFTLGLLRAEGAGEGVDDGWAGAGLLAALQAGVVVDADPGPPGSRGECSERGQAGPADTSARSCSKRRRQTPRANTSNGLGHGFEQGEEQQPTTHLRANGVFRLCLSTDRLGIPRLIARDPLCQPLGVVGASPPYDGRCHQMPDDRRITSSRNRRRRSHRRSSC